MSDTSAQSGEYRAYKDLSLVYISPFFIALFVLPIMQYIDLITRSWLYTNLLAELLTFLLGFIIGVMIAFRGTWWLRALVHEKKSSYKLSYHILFLLLPIFTMVFFVVIYAITGFYSLIQSISLLTMIVLSGFGLGLACITISSLVLTYFQTKQKNRTIVWIYHRGQSRFSGSVELSTLNQND